MTGRIEPNAPTTRAEFTGPFSVGSVLGGTYEIVKILGVGGMNVVYEARDLLLKRTVAIKTPLDAAYAPALHREAQALAAIRSPAFVSVFHLGREGNHEFVVMERIFGETLEHRLDELRSANRFMPMSEVLRVLVAITEALSIAHSRHVAHRDLKPANVLLTGERIVLLDLGLFVPEVLVSPENEVAGSAQYIAPEVLLRDVARGEGPLVDLYALGSLAFELLTNITPFMGDSTERVIANHLLGPIPDVRSIREDAPVTLAALIKELLAKDPRDRPPGAESVLWQLREIQLRGIHARHELKVLAIDDEPHVGKALKKSLESAFPRLRVDTTTDPTTALRREGDSHPDIVLVDLHMPEQNGMELCMQLLAIPPQRRPLIVAMSSQAEHSDVAVLRALGIRHFVPKDDAFLASMSSIIARVRADSVAPSP